MKHEFSIGKARGWWQVSKTTTKEKAVGAAGVVVVIGLVWWLL